jgi:hypothetical protein
MATARNNPYSAFNFIVTSTDDTTIGGFMEVSGLDTENAVIEYREGADQTGASAGAFVRKLPGLERYPNVMLRRGITGDLNLWTNLRQPIRDAKKGPEFAPSVKPRPPSRLLCRMRSTATYNHGRCRTPGFPS